MAGSICHDVALVCSVTTSQGLDGSLFLNSAFRENPALRWGKSCWARGDPRVRTGSTGHFAEARTLASFAGSELSLGGSLRREQVVSVLLCTDSGVHSIWHERRLAK